MTTSSFVDDAERYAATHVDLAGVVYYRAVVVHRTRVPKIVVVTETTAVSNSATSATATLRMSYHRRTQHVEELLVVRMAWLL